MTEEEYKKLYNRIKKDLYEEFLDPDTATYGLDVINEDIYERIDGWVDKNHGENSILNEIQNLKLILQEYLVTEEYEKAAIINERINDLKKKL